MATPLDTGLLGSFSIIFPFLLVFCITYALLVKTKVLGDNKSITAIISIVMGFLVLLFPIVREAINLMAPWFVLFMFGILFIVLMAMIFGFSEGDIMATLRSPAHSHINVWVVGIGILIVIGSLLTVISDFGGLGKTQGGLTVSLGEEGTQENSFWDAITHPKVLGLILILLIGAFTVSRLSGA